MGIWDFWTEIIGVDPGSQHLRLVKDGKIVFNEPSLIALDPDSGTVSGIGTFKKSDKDIAIKPVNYTIADFHAFEMLVRLAVKRLPGMNSTIPKSLISYWCIPTNVSETEKRAYRDSAEHANSKEVYLIHQAYCAAVGLNILFEKKNFILIEFGASKIEVSTFSNSMMVSTGIIRMGTWKAVQLIRNYLQRVHELQVDDLEIQNLFESLNESNTQEIEIKYTSVKTAEIKKIMDAFFCLVNDEINQAIEHLSKHPDREKIIANGVYFTGGGSSIDFLRNQIRLDERLKSTVSKTPLIDTVNGLAKIMSDKKKFKEYLMV